MTAQTAAKLSLEKKLASEPKLIDLAKKADTTLDKYQLNETIARVALVLDASGSMKEQYKTGKVQEVINRLLPLAVHFDDNAELDVWAFSQDAFRLPSVTLSNYSDFINTANWQNWVKYGNDEPKAIQAVLARYSYKKRSWWHRFIAWLKALFGLGQSKNLPVLVIFISDGGVNKDKEIKRLLTDAAHLPIFWQFVGIGGRNYGVLEKLDTLQGRFVDNCGFFALDDLHSVSEQELYDRLLKEFPLWLKAAKEKNII